MSKRKRYVLAGTGGRGTSMFGETLIGDFNDRAELVGLFDSNPARIAGSQAAMGTDLPAFTDYDELLQQLDPDCVIVCTRDNTHADYIIRALNAGKRVYSEKPLCTTAEQCRAIAAAAARSTGDCFVTHNMRYAPACSLIKAQLDSGAIGELISMEFRETLDRSHGADYFRRWHRKKENSGGLLIHKASHHFDILNWWAGGKPQLVNARGGTYFYGSNGPFRSTNCRNCEHTQACDFHIDLSTDERANLLYLGAEGEDGYYRDGCLYAEDIDTEDQAAVFYNYDNGVQVVYSLIAYASYEGLLAVFEGTKGRLELEIRYPTDVMGDNRVTPGLDKLAGERLTRYSREGVEQIDIPKVEGGHGGCDPSLLQEFIGQPWDAPRSNCMATLDEAIQAVIIGAAANASIAGNGAPINAQDLLV